MSPGPYDSLSKFTTKVTNLFNTEGYSTEEISLTWPSNSEGENAYDLTGEPVASKSKPALRVTTGWNKSLIILLLNAIVAFLWGIALFIFMTGVVPIAYSLSNTYGRNHPEITNVIVATVASTTTLHITFIIEKIADEYAHHIVVEGFTLEKLKWLKGVESQSLFTQFPDIKGRGKFSRFLTRRQWLWLVAYGGLFLHTTSLTAILQPSM